MKDTKPEKPEDWTPRLSVGDPRSPLGQALRSCQATIMKGLKGHTVTLTIHEDTQVRVIVDKTVESYREAETIARAIARGRRSPTQRRAYSSTLRHSAPFLCAGKRPGGYKLRME